MKYFIFLFFTFLLFSCSNSKSVYWCGDHACINKKEKEAYFKKTMIVEIRESGRQTKKKKSELEIIKESAGISEKKKTKKDKSLIEDDRSEKNEIIIKKKEPAKQVRLEEKRRIKEEKEIAKQVRLEEKRRIKEEKEIAKQVRLEEKKRSKKEKKLLVEKDSKKEDASHDYETLDVSTNEFNELVKKITMKNMFKSYPDINDIPN